MKKQTFKRKDGTDGWKFVCEDGDNFVSLRSSVGSRPSAVIAGEIKNTNFLAINYNGEEGFLRITDGQKKLLDKYGDLTNKELFCKSYKNKFGNQLGIYLKEAPLVKKA